MNVGCLGEIPFYVSSEAIQTIRNISWGGSVQIATHKLHLGDTLTEATGRNADTMDFEMQLSAYLGVNPWEALNRIWGYERGYIPLQLIIGDKAYGKYKWLIQSHKVKFEQTDGTGNLLSCNVQIKLIEYLKGGRP